MIKLKLLLGGAVIFGVGYAIGLVSHMIYMHRNYKIWAPANPKLNDPTSEEFAEFAAAWEARKLKIKSEKEDPQQDLISKIREDVSDIKEKLEGAQVFDADLTETTGFDDPEYGDYPTPEEADKEQEQFMIDQRNLFYAWMSRRKENKEEAPDLDEMNFPYEILHWAEEEGLLKDGKLYFEKMAEEQKSEQEEVKSMIEDEDGIVDDTENGIIEDPNAPIGQRVRLVYNPESPEERAKRRSQAPHQISQAQFEEDEHSTWRDKERGYMYYLGDDTLTNETDDPEPLFDVVGKKGAKILRNAKPGDIIYIRNERLESDYQIEIVDDSYHDEDNDGN